MKTDVSDLLLEISDLLENRVAKIDDREEAFRVLASVCIYMVAFPFAFLDSEGRGTYRKAALKKIPEIIEDYESFCARQEAH